MSTIYRSEDEPATSRTDRLLHITSNSLAPLDVRFGEPVFRGKVVTGTVGVSQIVELTIDMPAEAIRTPRTIRRSDPELYKVDVVVEGHMVVGQGGREARLGPGDLSIFDLSRPAYFMNQPARFVGVAFPERSCPWRRLNESAPTANAPKQRGSHDAEETAHGGGACRRPVAGHRQLRVGGRRRRGDGVRRSRVSERQRGRPRQGE